MESTTNYDLFKYTGLNRKLNKPHIQTLINESERMKEGGQEANITKISPVVVDQDMYVIDGQHRIKANEALGLPVFYVKHNMKAHDIIAMNIRRRSWKIEDYVNFYAGSGNENYVKLAELRETFPAIPYSDISRFNMLSNEHHTVAITSGKFLINNYQELYERLEIYNRLLELNSIFKVRSVLLGYIGAWKTKGFDPEAFNEAIRVAGGIFHASVDSAENYSEIMRLHDQYVKATKS